MSNLTSSYDEFVEALSRKFHAIYQAEAKRQYSADLDDVRHPDDYDALEDHTKEYGRVLAREVLHFLALLTAGLSNQHGIPVDIDDVVKAWAESGPWQ